MRKKLFSILALLIAVSNAWAEDITVYFTDAQGWGNVKVHYWGASNTDWPGTEMTCVETNEYNQKVYSANVPASVTGIIFNAGSNALQTPNIEEGIEDGAWWYYDGTSAVKIATYYVVGNITNWTINDTYKLRANTETQGEFYIHDMALTANSQIKVVSSINRGKSIMSWYPQSDGNYTINSDGIYSIYFRPDGNGGDDWHYHTFYVANTSAVNVPMAAEGYGTYYNSKFDATLPAGVTAKIVTGSESSGKLTYATIATGDNSGKSSANTVPAGTAVLLQGTSGNLTLSSHDTNITTPSTNLLHGSDVATTTTGGGTYYKYYKLSYQNGYTESDKQIGWYWGAAEGGVFPSGAHKAWLVLPAGSATRAFFDLPDSDEKTGISATRIVETKDNWYSIDGRRLNGKPVQRGVYINNGKKIIIK